jgi:HlyD family secretion protein
MNKEILMKSKKLWIILAVVVVLAGGAFFFRDSLTGLIGGSSATTAQAQGEQQNQGQDDQTVTIRPAAEVSQVSAAGNIALASLQAPVLKVQGVIEEIAVEAGDNVEAGDLLVKLDTTDLARAVKRAEINLAEAENQLAQLKEAASLAEIASAQASLTSAQENLAELQAGPEAAELQAATAGLAAAQASYTDLLDGATEPELIQTSAELLRAYNALQQAQQAYDQIAYRGDVGRTQQATDLQDATITYDTAKAAYDISTASATEAEVQTALQNISNAQAQLDALKTSRAELASADAQVASAEATLANLLDGPTETELRSSELAIQQAQIDLDEAQASLDAAELRAQTAGTILTVDVSVGQRASEDLSVLTMADLTDLELPVHVAEVDIPKVNIGQPVSISIDALTGQTFNGEVSQIAPISEADSGVVNYEVTIHLTDLELADGVRPGMTAVATVLNEATENAWLVPSNSLVEFEGETSLVVIRNGQDNRITVTPQTVQGEWTVVQSAELQSGDQVLGKVTSFIGEENGSGFRGPGGFGPAR